MTQPGGHPSEPSPAGRAAVLSLVGEVDLTTQADFRAEADALLLDEQVTDLIVDCSRTTLLDSAGISLLVHLRMLAGENHIGLALRCVPPCVSTLLRLTKLDRVLTVLDTPPFEIPTANAHPDA